VLSGFPLRRFTFEGFPPRASSARRKAFRAALAIEATTIWYESPQRIHDALTDLASVAPDARVFLVREYTKRFEQQVLGSPAAVAAALAEPVRGEIAFAVAPYEIESPASDVSDGNIDERIDRFLDEGRSVSDIAKTLADAGAGERRDLYARASARKRGRGGGESLAEDQAR
jgi:16S rRNA (cytidine1402-2'-O)-methyltransferase